MKKTAIILLALTLIALVALPAFAEETAETSSSMIDLTPVFQAILALLAALITGRLIPWIKARTTAEQQQRLQAAINTVVYAAEQLYGASHGPEKLQYACDSLAKMGFNADSTEVKAGIEAAVKALSIF